MDTSQVAADPHPVLLQSHLLGHLLHKSVSASLYSRSSVLEDGRDRFASKSWHSLIMGALSLAVSHYVSVGGTCMGKYDGRFSRVNGCRKQDKWLSLALLLMICQVLGVCQGKAK